MIAQTLPTSRLRWALLTSLTLALFASSVLSAEESEPPPVYLKIAPCVPVQAVLVRRGLASYFETFYPQVDAPLAGVTQVFVDCADTQIGLRVYDPLSGKSVRRHFDLWTVDPIVWERLLALAIAELVSVSRTELLADPSPIESAPASTAEPPSSARQGTAGNTPINEPRKRLLAMAATMVFFSGHELLFGGGLRFGSSHRRHLGWSLDLIAQHGGVTTGPGYVTIDVVSSSAALLYEWRWSRLAFHLGGGLRGGVAYLRGEPRSPTLVKGDSLLGPWGGPLLTASASVKLARRFVVEAQLEGGYALFSVIGRVVDSPAVRLEGLWLGGQLGIGLLP